MAKKIEDFSVWPVHLDGRNKMISEMTLDEQRSVFKAAADRRRLRAAQARGETTVPDGDEQL